MSLPDPHPAPEAADGPAGPHLIVAVGRDDAIGRGGELPWRAAEDLAMFRRVTTGHVLVMGRLTWESIGRPLPDRRIVVVTGRRLELPGTVTSAPDPDVALDAALADDPRPLVAGGATVYDALLPRVVRVLRTTVDVEVPDADTWFPPLDPSSWRLVTRQPGVDERLTFDVLDRVAP